MGSLSAGRAMAPPPLRFKTATASGAGKLRSQQPLAAGKLGQPLLRQRGSQLLAHQLPSTQHCAGGRQPRKRKFAADQAEFAHKFYPQPLARSGVCREFDGRISEAQHQRDCTKSFCIRCDFNRNRKTYEAHATYNYGAATWVSARSSNGTWGIGCKLCAAFAASGARSSGSLGVRCSKFANFQIRPKSQRLARWLLVQHRSSETHRLVSGTGARPPPQPLARICQPIPGIAAATGADMQSPLLSESLEDKALLKGNVPSPSEWKDAWAELSEAGASLRHEARVHEKRQSSASFANRRRKRRRCQLQIMAEVIRRNLRQAFREATRISLALDECKYQKVVRFRIDLPKQQQSSNCSGHVNASGFSLAGVLGILDCSNKHPSDFEDDHAVTGVKQLESFLTRFCTPLGRVAGHRDPQPLTCDEALKASIIEKVTCLSADGGPKERRAVILAGKELFPNLLIVIRDPAHAIRIATKTLHCDDMFGQVWHELFDGSNALAPDLMHSHKWHNLLVAIQEEYGKSDQGPVAAAGRPQPLARIERSLGFAKQRFDSTSEPVAKIALMFLPCATLLAYIASDRRHDREQRDRATALLKKLDSKFCVATGISADWGLICCWFLRLFDAANHDIAKSRLEIDAMIETLDAVFLEGRVFRNIIASPDSVGVHVGASESFPGIRTDQGADVGFITTAVMRNLRYGYVFRAGGLPVLHWGEPTEAICRELLSRVQNAAALTKERLLADFPRNDVRSHLAIFDRRLIYKGFGPMPDREVRPRLLHSIRKLAEMLNVEQEAAILQYHNVLAYMMEQMAPGKPLADKTNQQAWALLLDDDVWEDAGPGRFRAASGALRKVIRFYISIEDGECTVERDLGHVRHQKLVHRTDDLNFHDDCFIVRLNGPRTALEFDGGCSAVPEGQLTPFSRQCASLWRELKGRRKGHYNKSATAAAVLKRQMKRSSFGKVRQGVLAAARWAVASKRRGMSKLVPVHRGAGSEESPFWTNAMTRFSNQSRQNRIPGVTQLRVREGGAFFCPASVHLAPRKAADPQPLARTRTPSFIAAFDVPTPLVPTGTTARTGLHRCRQADLIVVSDLSILHDRGSMVASTDLLVNFVYIVSMGLDVVTQSQWASSAAWRGVAHAPREGDA